MPEIQENTVMQAVKEPVEPQKSAQATPDKTAAKKRNPVGTADQYLQALIKIADWVPEAYKKLAVQHKADPEAVKELYLCACDKVPAEKAMEALEKKPPGNALKFIRRKLLEDAATSGYGEELADVRRTAAALEQELKQMAEDIEQLSNHMPSFDDMFPDIPAQKNEEREGEKGKREPPAEGVTEDSPAGEDTPVKKEWKKWKRSPRRKNVPESGTKKRRLPWHRSRRISVYIEQLLEDGYESDQMDFLLDCIEDGMDITEIREFASPRLPVHVMKRLRDLKERERKENEHG